MQKKLITSLKMIKIFLKIIVFWDKIRFDVTISFKVFVLNTKW